MVDAIRPLVLSAFKKDILLSHPFLLRQAKDCVCWFGLYIIGANRIWMDTLFLLGEVSLETKKDNDATTSQKFGSQNLLATFIWQLGGYPSKWLDSQQQTWQYWLLLNSDCSDPEKKNSMAVLWCVFSANSRNGALNWSLSWKLTPRPWTSKSWKIAFLFWGPAYFQWQTVSFREG